MYFSPFVAVFRVLVRFSLVTVKSPFFIYSHQRSNAPTHQHLENERDAWHVTLGEIEWWQMADGSFLGSRFLTAYRLQFSMDTFSGKRSTLSAVEVNLFRMDVWNVIVSQISNLSFLWSSKRMKTEFLVYILILIFLFSCQSIFRSLENWDLRFEMARKKTVICKA